MRFLQEKPIKLQTDDYIFIELWLASPALAWLGIMNNSGEPKTFHVSTEPGDTRFEAAEGRTIPIGRKENFGHESLSGNEVWRVGVSNPKSGGNLIQIFECSYRQLYTYHTTGEPPDVTVISSTETASDEPSSVAENELRDELNNLSQGVGELRKAVVNVGRTVTKQLMPDLDRVKEDIEPLQEAFSDIRKRLGPEDDPFGRLDSVLRWAAYLTELEDHLRTGENDPFGLLVQLRAAADAFEEFQRDHKQLKNLTQHAKLLLDSYEENETNLETFQEGLDKVVELEKTGVLSKLEGAEPQIKAVTGQLEEMNAWFSKAQGLSAEMNETKNEVDTAATVSLEDAQKIQQRKDDIEQVYNTVDESSTKIQDGEQKAASSVEAIQQQLGEIQKIAGTLLQEMSTEAKTNIAQIRQRSEQIQVEVRDSVATIQETLAEIKHAGTSFHETLKQGESDFRETQAEWIRQETGRQFSLAAEKLQQNYLKEIGAGDLQQKGLQQAQELLEDFCQKMDVVEKEVPASIQNALQHIRSLGSQLDTLLPPLQPPKPLLSLQTHEDKQADQIADALLQDTAPQPQRYQSYVQQAYHQALKEYAQQLKSKVDANQISVTEEKLVREFRDLALVTLNPFDSKARQDKEMHQIITYFDKGVLPSLLEVFGYEEVPITIRQTQAVESLHEIVDGKPSQHPSGNIIEVLSKGLRSKQDPSDIVRRARVICAE